MRPDLEQIKQFIKTLGYQRGDEASFRFFFANDDPRAKSDHGRKAQVVLGDPGWDEAIARYQAEGRGAHFTINPGGSKDADIEECIALFCEWDDLEKSLQIDLWQSLGLPEPTMQVDSGGKSIHCYWVLDPPMPKRDWRTIQSDLLKFASADPALKNPARTMRLPGGWYLKPNVEPTQTKIINCSGKTYSPTDLRAVIPKQERPKEMNWADFDNDFSLPADRSIPIQICLQRKSRDLIETGTAEGRNDTGSQLARDLIGTENYLRSLGQRFDGNAYELFLSFCRHCPDDNWPETEWENIWKSALSSSPGPTLSPESIENCIKAECWRNRDIHIPRADHPDRPTQDNSPGLTHELSLAKKRLKQYEESLDTLSMEQQALEGEIGELESSIVKLRGNEALSYVDREQKIEGLTEDKAIKDAQLRRIKDRLKGARSDRHSQRVALNALRRDKAKSDKAAEPSPYEEDFNFIESIEGLSFNTLTQMAELDGVELELDHPRAELSARTGFTGFKTTDNSVLNLLLYRAKAASYCPIQQYLDRAANQHPNAHHKDLDRLAEKIFGVTSDVQNAFLKAFLIGAARRAFEPGCEHTYMLILHSSKQGKGKSTFIKNLFGKEFSGEGQINFDVDGLLAMNQSWVHEIDECDQVFTRRDASASKMKGFISVQVDTYRAPYGRSSKRNPRRTCMIGTTNHREFLTDETGNRRFAIIDIPDSFDIDLHWIEAHRNEIWAAAVHGVRNHEPNRIPEALFLAANEESIDFLEVDPWEEEIAAYIANMAEVSIKEIMSHCLKIETSKKGVGDQRRCGRILAKLGWKKIQTKRGGLNKRVWTRPTCEKSYVGRAETPTEKESQAEDSEAVPHSPTYENSMWDGQSPGTEGDSSDRPTCPTYNLSKPYIDRSRNQDLCDPSLIHRGLEQKLCGTCGTALETLTGHESLIPSHIDPLCGTCGTCQEIMTKNGEMDPKKEQGSIFDADPNVKECEPLGPNVTESEHVDPNPFGEEF